MDTLTIIVNTVVPTVVQQDPVDHDHVSKLETSSGAQIVSESGRLAILVV